MSKRFRTSSATDVSSVPPSSVNDESRTPIKITPFVSSIWSMLENEEFESIICWSQDGLFFQVLDPQQFEHIVLPEFFKHRKFTSFIRQLNMYSFKRQTTVSGSWEWRHECFQRDRKDLLGGIRRRTTENHIHNHSTSEDLQDHMTFLPIGATGACAERQALEMRVQLLEQSRDALVRELQVGHRNQTQMKEEIESLKSQMNGIMSVLLLQQTTLNMQASPQPSSSPLSSPPPPPPPPPSSPLPSPSSPSIPLSSVSLPQPLLSSTSSHRIDSSSHIMSNVVSDLLPTFSEENIVTNSQPLNDETLIPDSPGITFDDTINDELHLQMPSLKIEDPFEQSNESIIQHQQQQQQQQHHQQQHQHQQQQQQHQQPRNCKKIKNRMKNNDCDETVTECQGNILRTFRVSKDDDQVLQNTQACVHHLLQSLSNAYADKYGKSFLPKHFDAFGCWFVRAPLTSPDPVDPWSLLLFGAKSRAKT